MKRVVFPENISIPHKCQILIHRKHEKKKYNVSNKVISCKRKCTSTARQAHDVNTTSPQRCIDVEGTLYLRHVPAGWLTAYRTQPAQENCSWVN